MKNSLLITFGAFHTGEKFPHSILENSENYNLVINVHSNRISKIPALLISVVINLN